MKKVMLKIMFVILLIATPAWAEFCTVDDVCYQSGKTVQVGKHKYTKEAANQIGLYEVSRVCEYPECSTVVESSSLVGNKIVKKFAQKPWAEIVSQKTAENKTACDAVIFQSWVDTETGVVLPNSTVNQLGILATGQGNTDHVVERLDGTTSRWDVKITPGKAKAVIEEYRVFTDTNQTTLDTKNEACRACAAYDYNCLSACTWEP